MVIIFSQFFKLAGYRRYVEFLVKFPAAVLKSLIMEEYDVGIGELFSCLFGNAQI